MGRTELSKRLILMLHVLNYTTHKMVPSMCVSPGYAAAQPIYPPATTSSGANERDPDVHLNGLITFYDLEQQE